MFENIYLYYAFATAWDACIINHTNGYNAVSNMHTCYKYPVQMN